MSAGGRRGPGDRRGGPPVGQGGPGGSRRAGPPDNEGRYALRLDEGEVERYRMMAEQARAAEADLWELAGIGPGARAADVGCGPGAMLPALSAAVGPGGRVQAVDADPGAVAAARALVDAAGLENVTVTEGRADRTGLEPGSLDVVMLRHVLAHNGGAEDAIVAHLATLVRPGGWVYLVDVDGTAVRFLPDHADLDDLGERYLAFRAARGDDNRAGLRLADRLARAGLEVVEFRGRYTIASPPPGVRPPGWAAREAMLAAGVVTEADVQRWDRTFREVEAAPVPPTIFAPIFTAVGRRPA